MNRQEAEEFLFTEARLLDSYQLDEWLELTAADFRYWIPVNEPDADPSRHVSMLYEDRKDCAERIFRVLESDLNHPQDPPSRTVRCISNVEVHADESAGSTRVQCNLVLYEFRAPGQRRDTENRVHVFPAHCEYQMCRDGDRWLMASKKIEFVNLDGTLNAMTFYI
jgi:3-phenylpropionate/cinnamic acid dioxygenase small subunit